MDFGTSAVESDPQIPPSHFFRRKTPAVKPFVSVRQKRPERRDDFLGFSLHFQFVRLTEEAGPAMISLQWDDLAFSRWKTACLIND